MKKPANTVYRMMIALAVLLLPLTACGGGKETPCRADITPARTQTESTQQQQPAPNNINAASTSGKNNSENDAGKPPGKATIVQDNENTMRPSIARPLIWACLCPRN